MHAGKRSAKRLCRLPRRFKRHAVADVLHDQAPNGHTRLHGQVHPEDPAERRSDPVDFVDLEVEQKAIEIGEHLRKVRLRRCVVPDAIAAHCG